MLSCWRMQKKEQKRVGVSWQLLCPAMNSGLSMMEEGAMSSSLSPTLTSLIFPPPHHC